MADAAKLVVNVQGLPEVKREVARLRRALQQAAFVMDDCAESLAVEASNYQEHAVDERYRPIVRKLLTAAKAARKGLP